MILIARVAQKYQDVRRGRHVIGTDLERTVCLAGFGAGPSMEKCLENNSQLAEGSPSKPVLTVSRSLFILPCLRFDLTVRIIHDSATQIATSPPNKA